MIKPLFCRRARLVSLAAMSLAAVVALSGSLAFGQGFTLTKDGLFGVKAYRVVGGSGSNDNDLNDMNEALTIWNEIDGPFSPPGVVTIGSKIYNVDRYETDTETVINYGGDRANFDNNNPPPFPNIGYATINSDGPGGSGGGITGGDDFSIRAEAYLAVPVGTWSIAASSDDGRYIEMPGLLGLSTPGYTAVGDQQNLGGVGQDVVGYNNPTGIAQTAGVFTVAASDAFPGTNIALLQLDSSFFERGGGDAFEVFIKSGSDTGVPGGNNSHPQAYNDGWRLLSDGEFGWSISSTPIIVNVASPGQDHFWIGGTGNWTALNWEDPENSGLNTGTFPTGALTGNPAFVPAGTVNVTGVQGAFNLDIASTTSNTGGTVDVNGGGTLTVQDLTDIGATGTLDINGTFNTFRLTTAPGSLINLNNGGSLSFDSGTIDTLNVFGTATLNANGQTVTNLNMNSQLNSGEDYTAANTVLNAASTINQTAGTATLSNLSGPNLTKDGAGILVLNTNNPSYTGSTTVIDGVLSVSDGGALGTTAAGTVVQSGASLRLTGASFGISEPLTLYGPGDAASDGALHSDGSNHDVNGPITLGSNATIRKDGGGDLEFRGGGSGGINTAGFELRFETVNTTRIFDNGLSGTGTVVKEEDGTLEIRTNSPNYDGQININNGVVDLENRPTGLGSTVGATIVNNGGTLRLRGNVTTAENITINGNGQDQGAIRNDDNSNTLSGTLTVASNSRIDVDGDTTLTLSGQVTGGGNIEKTDSGRLILTNASNNYASVVLNGGALRIANTGALGGTTGLSVDGGQSLEFDGTMTIDATNLASLAVNSGALRGVSGTTTLNTPITVGAIADVEFGGDGNLIVNQPFGNGNAPVTGNAINHYGYHINNDGLALDLDSNGGMMGGGDPTTFQNFEGHGWLTSGPANRGLDFNNDADFRAVPAIFLDDASGDGFVIDQNDNYSNLWLGTLHVDALNAGNWEFRNAGDDDRAGIWLDLDQDGVFQSTTPGLGSNRGEQLSWESGSTFTRSLAAGDYMIAFTHREGGGGSRADFRIRSVATMGGQEIVKPTDSDQAGFYPFAVMPDNNVVKTDNGTVWLNAANTYNGSTTITGGTLVATNDLSLGLATGDVTVESGGTLALSGGVTVNKNDVTIDGTGAAGSAGAISNMDGTNVLNVASIAVSQSSQGPAGLGSAAGSLTINSPGGLAMNFSSLTLGGDGDLVLNADVTALSGQQFVDAVQGFVFSGNDYDDPGDSSQIQSVITGESLDLNGDGDFNAMFSQLNRNDNYASTFIGNLVIPDRLGGNTPYNVVFRGVRADDANEWWLDLDQDGTLSTSGASGNERIIDVGCCPTNFTATVNLAPGTYGFKLRHREGGGGSDLRPQIDIGDGSGFQFWDPGDMLGGVQLGMLLTANPEVVKTGSGTVTLTGNNSYTGPTTVLEGTLVAAHNNALGTAAAGTTVADGATLGLQGGVTITGEALTLGASPISPATLRNLSGNNAFNGPVSAQAGVVGEVQVVSASAGETLTIGGNVDLQQSNLRVSGAGNTTIAGGLSGADYYDPTYVDAVQAASPAAWWRFEDTGVAPGSTAVNSGTLGVAADGTYQGTGITTDTGRFDNAVEIQRTAGQHIDTVSANTLSMQDHSFTALAWFKRDETAGGDRMIFGNPSGGNDNQMHMGLRDSDPYMGFYGNDLRADFNVNDTDWHLVVFRFDDGGDPLNNSTNQQAIFLDDRAPVTRSGDLAFKSSAVIRLGHMSSDGNAFSGLLDEIIIFDRALTEQEISDLYARRDGVGWIYASNDLIKQGSGTLRLDGANTYNGTTTVAEGTLLVNGTHTGGGTYTVAAGAILGGTGSTDAPVDLFGTLAPGASVGEFQTAGQTWQPGASFEFEIDNATGTMGNQGGLGGWDLQTIDGELDLTNLDQGSFEVDIVSLLLGTDTSGLADNFSAYSSYAWDFAYATGGILDFDDEDFVLDDTDFLNPIDSPFGEGVFGIRRSLVDPDHYLQITFTAAIPEPSTFILAALGLLGLGLYARRRRRRAG